MYKFLIILFLVIGCSTTPKEKAVDENDTTNTEFKLIIPSKNIKVKEFNKKKVTLGSKSNFIFDCYIAQGHYWVTVVPEDLDVDLPKDAEVVLNIKQGDSSPESISLVKIDDKTFNGIGNGLSGTVNIELIFKIPKKKSIVFNFDIEV